MSDRARTLDRFAVAPAEGGGFMLTLADADGAVVRFTASAEQLDVLADLIDDALGAAEAD